jgi:FkbM family methyltransferase
VRVADGNILDVKAAGEEVGALLDRLERLPDTARARLQGELVAEVLRRTIRVESPRGAVEFVTLGRTSVGRALKMLTKQPATIAWIDGFAPGSVFWDVGANVGVYTLYTALRGDVDVVAFEPAAVNYFLLAANCEVNGFQGRTRCLLAGLGRTQAIADLAVSQFSAAQSFSFGGRKAEVFAGRQAALVLSMDQAIADYGLPVPNYIKIDVPVMTREILAGGATTLSRPEVREVHIEASTTSSGGRHVIDTLAGHGLMLSDATAHGGSSDLTFVRSAS